MFLCLVIFFRRRYECNYRCPCADRLKANGGNGDEPKDCGLRASQARLFRVVEVVHLWAKLPGQETALSPLFTARKFAVVFLQWCRTTWATWAGSGSKFALIFLDLIANCSYEVRQRVRHNFPWLVTDLLFIRTAGQAASVPQCVLTDATNYWFQCGTLGPTLHVCVGWTSPVEHGG